MANSDDEMSLPDTVTKYYFEDDNNDAISFAVLPIVWSTTDTTKSKKMQIYLHGYADEGLQKIFQPVKAWKFDITGEKPEISVRSKDNWIKLQKPRKSYEPILKTVLVTVNFLHLVRKDPELSGKAIWNKLSQIFSLYESEPSLKDLVDHKGLLKEALKHDESLSRSKYLLACLEKKLRGKKRADEDASNKDKKGFIVEDDEDEDSSAGEEGGSGDEEDGQKSEEDGDEDPYDSVCCICDNGGDLVCCDGICMRSFHGTRRAAEEAESGCDSLGLTEREVKANDFVCKNCQTKQHQCFACGRLGSSDKSLGAEVFQCANATCGYFYHTHCVAKLLRRDSEVAVRELEAKILAGESFACPLHICYVCQQPEDKTVDELQMAVCRRCPKAYHAKCLPKEIAFEDDDNDEDEDEDIIPRAWRNLLVDRILIYCLNHEIVEDLGTPERNHIKFPGDEEKEDPTETVKGDVVSNKKKPLSSTIQLGTAIQPKKKTVKDGHLDKKTNLKLPKLKGPDPSKKPSTVKKSGSTKVKKEVLGSSKVEDHPNSLGDQLYALYKQESGKPRKSEQLAEEKPTKASEDVVKTLVAQLDSDSEKRILELMTESSSIITLDDIIAKHDKVIPSRTYMQQLDRNKNITLGKVQVSCEAVRAAIRKLDGGGSIEDARAICEPRILDQVVKWKSKLKVYLSPFLNGMRYTSFGRHFTKIDKLKEIVDKIHCYVKSGDMIVDFCCGANDFSWLMKQKLEQAGKKCSYKNYDLFRPKNDFNFEKRDWMTVEPGELPDGSQLIMGLNPPFGVRAGRANQFIDRALKFKPKLLILIVPPETERLDKKDPPYDLIWEDCAKLSGKSFYLPGSVDVNDKQMEDWNKVAPVLYLWSRPDWTAKHRAIAEKHGHLHGKTDHRNREIGNFSLKNHDHTNDIVKEVGDTSPQNVPSKGLRETETRGKTEDLGNRSVRNDHEGDKHTSNALGSSRGNQGSTKKRQREEPKRRQSSPMNGHREEKPSRTAETIPEPKRRQSSPSPSNNHREVNQGRAAEPFLEPRRWQSSPRSAHHGGGSRHSLSPGSTREGRLTMEVYSGRHQVPRSNPEIGYPDFNPPIEHPSYAAYGTANDRTQDAYYPGRIDNFNHRETDPLMGRRDRWPIDEGPRPVQFAPPNYRRETEGYGFNQPGQTEIELNYRSSTYSMDSSLSGRSSMPASQRYTFPLNETGHARMGDFDQQMPHDAGGGGYNHQAPRPRYPPGDHMVFAPGPLNYHHPGHGAYHGWLDDYNENR